MCIHGHFYQPPRENAWLEQVEYQNSAAPFHDWNERITEECYAPNTAARTVNKDRRIIKIGNNFEGISFNIGPTLLHWMRFHATDVYEAILEADKTSQAVFGGHGNAIAQAYNHLIMPLANRRDKRTQILWGMEDFRFHFGRDPEGMWLPETAVDLETRDLMAEQGIRFTILAPRQARRVQDPGGEWHDANPATLDTSQPYQVVLPSGRTIAVFFFNAGLSHAVAFERLLDDGKVFAERLARGLPNMGRPAGLSHIATDGETYGHHHRHGEMALAYALHHLRQSGMATLTNYGQYLEKFPPTLEVNLHPNTSWSCAHGVERWRSDCGCRAGSHPGWNQRWRTGLRNALDWLRDELAKVYEEQGGEVFHDPWKARDAFVSVLLDRSVINTTRFLEEHVKAELDAAMRVKALTLLHMEKCAMFMFTSCAWFFDELTGIETTQVMQYAARGLQLSRHLNGYNLREDFLQRLKEAKSNISGDGRKIYETMVEAAMVDLAQVCAHFAITSLFEYHEEVTPIGNFQVKREQMDQHEAGRARLVLGRAQVGSGATERTKTFTFGAVHLGDHNVHCGVEPCETACMDDASLDKITTAFNHGDLPTTILLLDKQLGEPHYSLKSLFRDEQRRVLNIILHGAEEEAETDMRQVYAANASLMRFLADIQVSPPKSFLAASEVVLNGLLNEALKGKIDPARVRMLFQEAQLMAIPLDTSRLALTLLRSLAAISADWMDDPTSLTTLKRLDEAVALQEDLPLSLDLWEIQNHVYKVMHEHYPAFAQQQAQGDALAGRWLDHFRSLANQLMLAIP